MTTYPHALGAVIMFRNESATMLLTLQSVVGVVDCVCAYDTGSTDNTCELVQQFCEEHKLPLYLIHGTFVDFSTSRNVLVEHAEKYCAYQVHLDAADVVLGGKALKTLAHSYKGTATSFMCFQQWFMGSSSIRFRNLRVVKSGHGYRYKCRVHEILIKPDFDANADTIAIDTKFDERPQATNNPDGSPPFTGFVIFQNRTLDNTKTLQRFQRDAVMLYDDYLADRKDTRTLFYLAQTYHHMGDPQRGYLWYQKRIDRMYEGFIEEVLHAMLRSGKLAERLGMDTSIAEKHYWQTIEFSMRHWQGRVLLEPVMTLMAIYDARKEFGRAYTLLKSVMDEPYPVQMNLFVDSGPYKYWRYHWMGRIGWYVGQYVIGGWYSIVAYRAQPGETDKNNLRIYLTASPIPGGADKWKDEKLVDTLLTRCPSLAAFEQSWMTGDMTSFPKESIVGGSTVDTSIASLTAQSGAWKPNQKTEPEPSHKQKLQAKRQQQRLMRKAK